LTVIASHGCTVVSAYSRFSESQAEISLFEKPGERERQRLSHGAAAPNITTGNAFNVLQ
jgi:hypothetical protein